jgi:predicted dehydrogenase
MRTAVIGIGHLGRQHARILSALEGARLTAVVDTIEERAAAAAAVTGAAALTDYRALVGEVDAVTVAVPTELHHQVALPFLERGTAVLVEKPMARTLVEADELIAAARTSGATLAVGHTERYNPAVTKVFPLVTSPRFIEVHRLGVFPERSLDIDVVFDLMIHDLDVILSLVKSEYLSIDYAAQEIEGWRLVRGEGRPSIQGGPIPVEHDEPLRVELADFIGAARDGGTPIVDGEAGRRALALATRVAEKMESV